jgi:shikimate dehydrogenase
VAPEDVKSLATAVEGADLVVNATPLGMEPATTLRRAMEQARQWLVPPELFHPGQVAADLVYVPRRTPWLVEAEERGATPVDGLGMLVHQAAGAITRWTGREAPVEAMWQAAVAALPDEPN